MKLWNMFVGTLGISMIVWGLSGCDNEKGPVIGGTEQADIQYSCIAPPTATLPDNVTYALNSQQVACSNQPNDYSPSSYPPFTTLCSGSPGTNQIDVWVINAQSPPVRWCARISVPSTGYALGWHDVMKRGWLGVLTGWPYYNMHIQSLVMGPGTGAHMTNGEWADPGGCFNQGACFNKTNSDFHPNAYSVDTVIYLDLPSALYFYRL